METYKSQVEELKSLVDKLEKGELSINELVQLEEVTRKLHERSIILKYKAFEVQVNGHSTNEEAENVLVETPKVEERIEVAKEEPIQQVEESLFDLSIFDTEDAESDEEELEDSVLEMEEEVEPVIDEEAPDDVLAYQEVVIEELDEEEEPEEVIAEETEMETVPKPSGKPSFFDKIDLSDNSLAGQFTGGKIESLIGAFGLNERLRYINNLFDGSSEMFSESIKMLDSQHSFDEAKEKAEEMAQEHEWDVEDENVLEFMTLVKRRYA